MLSDITPDEFLYNFTFGLQPVAYSGALAASSRTPNRMCASLGLLMHSEVFLYSENHTLANMTWG
jgi:hypothetical protein